MCSKWLIRVQRVVHSCAAGFSFVQQVSQNLLNASKYVWCFCETTLHETDFIY